MVFHWSPFRTACCAIKNFAALITYKLRRLWRPRSVTGWKSEGNYADKLKGFAHMFSMASKGAM